MCTQDTKEVFPFGATTILRFGILGTAQLRRSSRFFGLRHVYKIITHEDGNSSRVGEYRGETCDTARCWSQPAAMYSPNDHT